MTAAGALRTSPSALRNREPIAEVLRDWLPPAGAVLEVASGTGEHAVYLAKRFPNITWQPSDADSATLASIAAWREEEVLPNLAAPIQLDASGEWPTGLNADAILCINMAHISPWAATLGLLSNAGRLLREGEPLIFYGPWFARDIEAAPSNVEFDASLRTRNPEWSIRSVDDLISAASARQFSLAERRSMPANNLMLLLRRERDRR